MRQFGLIGYPLTSSFSKKYFAEKFEREHIPECDYDNYPLQNIAEFPALLGSVPNLAGLNVTIPYKKEVVNYLHESTDAVKQMHACNCIKITNGILKGFNTDVVGFSDSFKPLLQPFHTKALVLGTGGAAAAVEYVLRQLDISFLSVSREVKGKKNAISYTDIDEGFLEQYKVIINTTPLGMFPDSDTFPELPYNYLDNSFYLYDLVYNPAETQFLKKGREQGAIVKNGSDMLFIQAEAGWKIWNDPTL